VLAGESGFWIRERRERRADGSARGRFVFDVLMADRDADLLHDLQRTLRVGRVRMIPPRRAGWLASAQLRITARADNVERVVPFADRYLLPSAKRDAFLAWRAELLRERPTGEPEAEPSMCTVTDLAHQIAGFVAAEGTFTASGPRYFAFAVALGATDAATCDLLQAFLGVGRIRRYARRRPTYDDEVVFVVRRLGDLVQVLVPFFDEHLLASHKRVQYLAWRARFLEYRHYYLVHGR
jgi:hypothetical protein